MRAISGLMHVEPLDCPAGYVIADCWSCPYFGCMDPDNVGEPVVMCRYSEENKEEEK